VYQNTILKQGFNEYNAVKEKFLESGLIEHNAESQRKNYKVYLTFRRHGWAVIGALRLKKLRKNAVQIKPVDVVSLRNNLSSCNEATINLYISLLRINEITIDQELMNNVSEILYKCETKDEDQAIFKLIQLGLKKRVPKMPQLEIPSLRLDLRSVVDVIVEELYSNEDFKRRLELVEKNSVEAESYYRERESYYREREDRMREEFTKISQEVQELLEENQRCKEERDKIHNDYEYAKDQLENLLRVIEDKRDFDMEKQTKDILIKENFYNLESKLEIVTRHIEDLEGELEAKNFKILQLQKQLFNSTNFIQLEPSPELATTIFSDMTMNSKRGGETLKETLKVPGKIHYSNRKPN